MAKKPPPVELLFGPMPTRLLRKLFNIEIDDGEVVLTDANNRHAQRRHPADYAICFPHIAAAIADPIFVGDDFNNAGKVELLGSIPGRSEYLLVAVSIEVDESGRYRIASFYPVARAKADDRRIRGFLKATLGV